MDTRAYLRNADKRKYPNPWKAEDINALLSKVAKKSGLNKEEVGELVKSVVYSSNTTIDSIEALQVLGIKETALRISKHIVWVVSEETLPDIGLVVMLRELLKKVL